MAARAEMIWVKFVVYIVIGLWRYDREKAGQD